ncbi:MAG: class I SAM-dependent methyltransferase, partial [Sulfuricaulis sp.]|nr:class I SAM-dependent methyltransferase [Sulfuricaulis sp.]
MMRAGERQVAETLEGIRADHRHRYEFAARILPSGSRMLDFAAGIGYGSKIMADCGHLIRSYDIDAEALAYGREHYPHSGEYLQANGNAPGELGDYDAAVCFETIEHLQDPRPLLKALRVSAPTLIASVPNEDVMPYEYEPGKVYEFHYRHYTKHEFKSLLQECGWCVTEWYGQEGPESDVERNNHGLTLIAVATRDVIPDRAAESGKHVAILGLGPSLD